MTATTVNSKRSPAGPATVLAACLLAGSLGTEAATPQAGPPQMAVSYGDLDLSSSDGARELYRRISRAAERVCPYPDARILSEIEVNHHCRDAAIARAVREVNSPQLAALRAERAKRG